MIREFRERARRCCGAPKHVSEKLGERPVARIVAVLLHVFLQLGEHARSVLDRSDEERHRLGHEFELVLVKVKPRPRLHHSLALMIGFRARRRLLRSDGIIIT